MTKLKKNKLGQIVANQNKKPLYELFNEYFEELIKLFSKLPSKKNYINSYLHIFGYFSKDISKNEREFLLDLIEKYRNNQIEKTTIANVLKSYVIKYNIDYLLNQRIFSPFPDGLVSLIDSSIKH